MASSSLYLTRLRSQLQHISSEFDNLTVAELQQMKFRLQQRVFMEIAMYSPLLRGSDLCARSAELIERSQRVAKHQGKEQRQDAERETRLRFMALVQEALVMLAWPPACEPFADILTPLMSDRTFFLSAVEFMLTSVLPAPTPLDNQKRPTSNASTPSKSAAQLKLSISREGPPKATSETTTPVPPKPAIAKDNDRTEHATTPIYDELSRQQYEALKASFLVRSLLSDGWLCSEPTALL